MFTRGVLARTCHAVYERGTLGKAWNLLRRFVNRGDHWSRNGSSTKGHMAGLPALVHAGVVVILSAGLVACDDQPESESAASLNWSADDSSRIAWLEANGDTIVNASVRIWFPPDSISRGVVSDVSDQLDRAVPYLNRLIGAPLEWQRHRGTHCDLSGRRSLCRPPCVDRSRVHPRQ